MKCVKCKFLDKKDKVCRRHPPKLLESGESKCPSVDPEKHWCGEFKQAFDEAIKQAKVLRDRFRDIDTK